MQISNPLKGLLKAPGAPGNVQASPPVPGQVATISPGTVQAPASAGAQVPNTPQPLMQSIDTVNIVALSPEKLQAHVQDISSRVDFSMSGAARFRYGVGTFWSIVGPALLASGTAGEVYAVIMLHTQDSAKNLATQVAVLASVIACEFCFMVTTYLATNIRTSIAQKPTGPTSEDKADLARHKTLWYVTGAFIAVSQCLFLLTTLTSASGSTLVLIVVFAIVRPLGTLASDFGTAFVHKDRPTTADEAVRQQEQREKLNVALLAQLNHEVEVINKGTTSFLRTHAESAIEQDSLNTEMAARKMENKDRLDNMRAKAEQAALFAALQNNVFRARYDPSMPESERKILLEMDAAMGDAARKLFQTQAEANGTAKKKKPTELKYKIEEDI